MKTVATDTRPDPAPRTDRRATQRTELHAEVDFESDHNFYMGLTEDISEGGLFVATVMLRELDSLLMLRFSLPNGHEVECLGCVRWIRDVEHDADSGPGMGIEFLNLKRQDEEAIRHFVLRRQPLFYEE